MKREIDSRPEILSWLESPEPAVFQGQDLREFDSAMAGSDLSDCTFLGCELGKELAAAVALPENECSIIHKPSSLPFNPFKSTLYNSEELYNNYHVDIEHSYKKCLDREIYCSYVDCEIDVPDKDRPLREVDVEEMLMRRIHDASISEALDDLLDEPTKKRTVAIMGGHDIPRGDFSYTQTVHLAYQLSRLGYLIATGGGPGLMEAANLGACLAGFPNGVEKIDAVVALLSKAPVYDHPDWLEIGFRAKLLLGAPSDYELSKNVGIPTWFYGHEPPNVFATHVAKYFENSAREDGLLAVAWAGVIFARGNGGTVQEIFQDANQNYYKIFGKLQSPMVLLESQYWNPVPGITPIEKAKPVYPLLLALAKEKEFESKILLTDSPDEIVEFISRHSPVQ